MSFTDGHKKGCTLIELLVVLAVVGILAGIVLAALNSARVKGADTAIKTQLKNTYTEAEIFFHTYGNYTVGDQGATTCNSVAGDTGAVFANDATFMSMIKAAGNLSVPGSGLSKAWCMAVASPQGWSVSVPLKSNPAHSWCIDNRGGVIEIVGSTQAVPCQ